MQDRNGERSEMLQGRAEALNQEESIRNNPFLILYQLIFLGAKQPQHIYLFVRLFVCPLKQLIKNSSEYLFRVNPGQVFTVILIRSYVMNFHGSEHKKTTVKPSPTPSPPGKLAEPVSFSTVI